MGKGVDDYLLKVVGAGGEMSALLEQRFAGTLNNSPLVEILSGGVNGVKTLTPPAGMLAVVHSLGGNHELTDSIKYASSAVDRLVRAAESIGATPAGMANVIDAREGKADLILPFADGLVERANHFRLPVLNGELAVLGDRMNADANVSVTMVSFIPKNANLPVTEIPSYFIQNGVRFAVFDPAGKPIYMNSDGVGTKTDIYERAGTHDLAFIDSLAMKLDDLVKIGAEARVVSDVVETNSRKDVEVLGRSFMGLGFAGIRGASDLIYTIQHEFTGNRLRPTKDGRFTYNVSGSSISTVDENRLNNPLKPSAGEYLIAVRGRLPNGRSNGFTDMRKVMTQMLEDDWHETEIGRRFISEYLGNPSDVFYPTFRSMIDRGLATSVYHMSGGGFDGKLSKPLAKHGLFVEVQGLFSPHNVALEIAKYRNTGNESSYAKWPMGNPGFITTNYIDDSLCMLEESGFEGRVVGLLEKSKEGLTGVRLKGVMNSRCEPVYYSGRN
ncbi:MAG: AIR synthase related protein [Nanoarchaeota archaeon]